MKLVRTDSLEGDVMNVRLELDDEEAFDNAVHNLENRRRATEGLPSLEQEAERAAMIKKATEEGQARSQEEADKAEADRQASRDRIEAMAAKDRYVKEHQTPAPAPEPHAASESKEEVKQPPTAKEPEKVQ
jgi:hypothetical protein